MVDWENVGFSPLVTMIIRAFLFLCFWCPVVLSCIANMTGTGSSDRDDFYEVYDEEYEDW